MAELEEKHRKRRKKSDLQKIILSTISTAGMLSAAAVAPQVVGALAQLGVIPHKRYSDSIRAAQARLRKKGYLVFEGGKLRLTALGQRKLRQLSLREYKLPKPKHWDMRWRVLIFDIPEHRKAMRNKLRYTLGQVGFIKLQDSVWIYPHNCEDFIALLKADFKIGKDLLYMIVDMLEYDAPIRKKFGLPL